MLKDADSCDVKHVAWEKKLQGYIFTNDWQFVIFTKMSLYTVYTYSVYVETETWQKLMSERVLSEALSYIYNQS